MLFSTLASHQVMSSDFFFCVHSIVSSAARAFQSHLSISAGSAARGGVGLEFFPLSASRNMVPTNAQSAPLLARKSLRLEKAVAKRRFCSSAERKGVKKPAENTICFPVTSLRRLLRSTGALSMPPALKLPANQSTVKRSRSEEEERPVRNCFRDRYAWL